MKMIEIENPDTEKQIASEDSADTGIGTVAEERGARSGLNANKAKL